MKEEKDSIKDLIERSGNNFHFKVVKFLREKEWEVLISPYYTDNITDKSREIDIIAKKGFDVTTTPFDKYLGTLKVQLFIECKYVNRGIVFWFDNKDEEKSIKRITTDTPIKHPNESALIKKHHYYTGKQVAKLFASSPDKLQDNEIIYRALNQSLNAMVYYKSSTSTILAERSGRRDLLTVNYPLILCSSFDEFHKVDPEKDEGHSKIDRNFQLEVNYAYLDKDKNSKNDYFLVDIIDFNLFDEFLGMLEKADIEAIKDIF